MNITGSIERDAKHRYLSYSKGDFENFRPVRASRCNDGGKIWHGRLGQVSLHSSMSNFTTIGATIRVQDPQTEILLKIRQIVQNLYDVSGCVSC